MTENFTDIADRNAIKSRMPRQTLKGRASDDNKTAFVSPYGK